MTNAQQLERNRRYHFCRRVRERIGPHVDGKALWSVLVDQMDNPDPEYLVLLARVNKDGRRLWRFKLGDDWHLVLFDHHDNHPVTILHPKGRLYRQRGSSINLEHYA